jgi:hypothetical protein
MKMKKYASFDDYLDDQPPKNRSIIRALRHFVKRVESGLEESVKWGNGCWVKGKVPVSYVYSAPDHVQFGFFRGSALKDPTGPSRRQWPVRTARQGPQTLRHRRGRVQSAPATSGALIDSPCIYEIRKVRDSFFIRCRRRGCMLTMQE